MAGTLGGSSRVAGSGDGNTRSCDSTITSTGFGCGSGLDPRKPTKIGTFGANEFGLHDTAGNIAEWVHDCWHDNYKNAPSDDEVWEGGDCAFRSARGGSYSSPPQSIRHTKRDKFKSDSAYDHGGIRVVRDID